MKKRTHRSDAPLVIAALYVDLRGPYIGLPGVDPWGLPDRDAREYRGPYPVVAHPPCARWGSYWYGGPTLAKRGIRLERGDDGGCFEAALLAVRRYGGVLEHPAYTSAFRWFGMPTPKPGGGWQADIYGGFAIHVCQGWYGHRARKATWLYAVGCEMPSLEWRECKPKERLEDGFHSAEERRAAKAAGLVPCVRLPHTARRRTPIPFRDILIAMARSVYAGGVEDG